MIQAAARGVTCACFVCARALAYKTWLDPDTCTSFLYFYAPAVVDSAQMAHMLMDSVFIKDVIDKARSVDLAIVSPDVISEGASLKRFGYMASVEVTEYQKADITGNILCSFFNRSGKEVSTALSKRMVGPHLKDLKFIPRVLLLACGVKKVFQ